MQAGGGGGGVRTLLVFLFRFTHLLMSGLCWCGGRCMSSECNIGYKLKGSWHSKVARAQICVFSANVTVNWTLDI